MEQTITAQLEDVRVHPKKVDDYVHILGEKPIIEIKKLASRLKGKRLVK